MSIPPKTHLRHSYLHEGVQLDIHLKMQHWNPCLPAGHENLDRDLTRANPLSNNTDSMTLSLNF